MNKKKIKGWILIVYQSKRYKIITYQSAFKNNFKVNRLLTKHIFEKKKPHNKHKENLIRRKKLLLTFFLRLYGSYNNRT